MADKKKTTQQCDIGRVVRNLRMTLFFLIPTSTKIRKEKIEQKMLKTAIMLGMWGFGARVC